MSEKIVQFNEEVIKGKMENCNNKLNTLRE